MSPSFFNEINNIVSLFFYGQKIQSLLFKNIKLQESLKQSEFLMKNNQTASIEILI